MDKPVLKLEFRNTAGTLTDSYVFSFCRLVSPFKEQFFQCFQFKSAINFLLIFLVSQSLFQLLFLQNQFSPYNGQWSRFRCRRTKTATPSWWWCVKERHNSCCCRWCSCVARRMHNEIPVRCACVALKLHTTAFAYENGLLAVGCTYLYSFAERTILYGFKRKCIRRSPGGRTGSVEYGNNGVVNWKRAAGMVL